MAEARALVFGSTGWIGRRVGAALQGRARVAAPGGRAACDLRDASSVARAVDAAFAPLLPDAVLNLAALQPSGGDEAAMAAVNETGARNVAAACAARGVRLVHMSTDLVLDGRSAPYGDDAPPSPVNAYGRTKAAGERAVLDASDGRALVIRTSLVVDRDEPDRLTARFLAGLARGEPCTLFVDELRCAITRDDLARALGDILLLPSCRDLRGRLNVAGAEAISRRDLGMLLLARFGATRLDLVREARAAGHPEPRPLDLTLDVGRASRALGRPLPGIRDALIV